MAKLKVGITGGIGSGKSYCVRYFKALGIPFYSADDRAKELMVTDPAVQTELVALLGKNVYLPDGNLNKIFMREQIFGNYLVRESVNSIVHPAVGRDYDTWHAKQTGPFTLKEAALLVESGLSQQLDCLIAVKAPLSLRIQRVMARDGISSEEALRRIESQRSETEILEAADSIIDNSGTEPLLPQIIKLYTQLTKMK